MKENTEIMTLRKKHQPSSYRVTISFGFNDADPEDGDYLCKPM